MKRPEAATIVSTLLAGFHGETLENDALELWTIEIERLSDYVTASTVAREMIRGGDRMPTLHQFREAYNHRAKDLADQRAEERGLPEPPRKPGKTPEWINVWWWARRARSPRVAEPFPQQAGFCDPLAMMSDARYDELRGEWVLAGAPRCTISDMGIVREAA